MEEQDVQTDEAASEAPKHMRKVLEALPTLDDEPTQSTQQPADALDDQTVIVTHAAIPTATSEGSQSDAAQDETTVLGTAAPLPEGGSPTPMQDLSSPTDEEQALASLGAASATEPLPEGAAPPTLEAATAPAAIPEVVTEGAQAVESPFAHHEAQTRKAKVAKVLKRLLVVLLCIAGALSAVYLAAGLYFSSHFLPNTTVNGEDVSGMSVSDLAAYVTSIGENYQTKVLGDGIDLTITGPEIGFVYDGGAYSQQAADQIDPWKWPVNIAGTHAYVVNQAISFDEAKLNEIVGAAVDKANEGATQPTNATMAYDEASTSFVVVPDALGTAINRDAVIPMVSEGVTTMQTSIELGTDELVQPTVTADDQKLASTIESVNKVMETSVALRVADTDVLTIDKNLLASWLSLDAETNVSVNQDAIKGWAQGDLSAQLDTTGIKRTFTRADGKQIEVEGGSADYDYGWCIDGEALANTLSENLRNVSANAIDVPMKKTAASWTPGGKDWPNRYIDVDLSEQHVRMYDDSNNVIWESDCVSGDPKYGGGTDTGVFFIYLKASPMELVGFDYNNDGEPDYRTWVTYWMPFDGGEGLHDISRYAFGGDIYTYNGSHGCVNLPYSAAEQLWNLTNVGDVVVVHW